MDIFQSIRRSMLVAPLALFGARAVSAPAVAIATMPVPAAACRGAVTPAEPGKLPVVQAGEDFACLNDVATGSQAPATTITHEFVPAAAGCSSDPQNHRNATRISVTAFNNAGNLDFNADFKRKDALVVAKIVNNTNCATRGIALAAHRTYYLVIEHRGTDARLVTTDGEIRLRHFRSCRAEGFPDGTNQPRENLVMLKVKDADLSRGECNHRHTPDGRLGAAMDSGSPFRLASLARPSQGGLDLVIWMTCGGDCCFADL